MRANLRPITNKMIIIIHCSHLFLFFREFSTFHNTQEVILTANFDILLQVVCLNLLLFTRLTCERTTAQTFLRSISPTLALYTNIFKSKHVQAWKSTYRSHYTTSGSPIIIIIIIR